MKAVSIIRLNGENADITIGEKTFTVSRRDSGHDTGICPSELIIAALGS